MRLTLRTLLAYLDDVLDPSDKEELAKKIESSDFAEDLVHRTRDTVRRLRLSAPQVVGTGMGLDPNSVAEYLDNVMPPDQVGDYERICLESDVHLAEAAACHHVLTMVLGQPADVEPLARQRMYSIATEAGERKRLRVEPAHTAPTTTVAVATPGQPVHVAPASVMESRVDEIPEYLRAGAWWRSWGILAGLAAVVIVGITVLLASGISGWFKREPSLVALTPESVAQTTENAPSNTPSNSSNAPPATEPSATETQPGSSTENSSAQAQPVAPLGSPPQPLTPGISPSAEPQAAKSGEPNRYEVPSPATSATALPPQTGATPPELTTEAPATGTAAVPPVDDKGGDVPNPNTTPPAPNGTPGAATVNIPSAPANPLPAVTTNPPALPPQSTPDKGAVAAADVPAVPAALDSNVNPGANTKAPAGPPELGTYMGGKTVLLRYDGKANTWFRVEPRAAMIAGTRILSLPEFRPKIAMVSGLQLDLSGGTQVLIVGDAEPKADALSAAAVPQIPTIELVYGRIVLINAANSETRVRLKLDSATGEAQLGRNAALAVEVERKHVPGQDPRQQSAPIESRLFAPDGGVVWKDAAGSKTIDKASRWTVGTAGATAPVADPSPPEWIYREPIGQLSEQRYGAPKIEGTMVSNIPAETQLLEIFQSSKQKEVKSLVARSSMHVGLFVPFVDALRDSEQKANWKSHIDTLRAAMSLSPESATKVWQTLVDQRGRPAATDLYEMLCGYNADQVGHTPEQMKEGALLKLIDWLESDSLDYRVLAVHDLGEITGKRLMSNPAAPPAERTQSIRKWRARLDEGDLKPLTAGQ